jgi:DtxR family Mn-dependent transcriptional regulator
VGKTLHVAEVDDASPELLRYLAELHLVPGQCITITERAPFDGPVLVQVGDRTHALGHQAAAAIRVTEPVAA